MDKAPRESTSAQLAKAAAVCAAGMAPFVRSPIAEMMALIMSAGYNRRLDQWRDSVVEAIEDLQDCLDEPVDIQSLAKAGMDKVPDTFDGLLDAVAKLKSAGVHTPIALAGANQWPELMWIEYLVDRYAGPELFTKIFKGDASACGFPGCTWCCRCTTEPARPSLTGVPGTCMAVRYRWEEWEDMRPWPHTVAYPP